MSAPPGVIQPADNSAIRGEDVAQLAGFFSGLGAATADAVFGIIAAFGLTVISDLLLDYRDWLRVGGGAFLLYIGVAAFVADPLAGTQSQRDPEDLLSDYLSTFALTITN